MKPDDGNAGVPDETVEGLEMSLSGWTGSPSPSVNTQSAVGDADGDALGALPLPPSGEHVDGRRVELDATAGVGGLARDSWSS